MISQPARGAAASSARPRSGAHSDAPANPPAPTSSAASSLPSGGTSGGAAFDLIHRLHDARVRSARDKAEAAAAEHTLASELEKADAALAVCHRDLRSLWASRRLLLDKVEQLEGQGAREQAPPAAPVPIAAGADGVAAWMAIEQRDAEIRRLMAEVHDAVKAAEAERARGTALETMVAEAQEAAREAQEATMLLARRRR